MLEHGDHDYQGHRAKAVHEITQAIHDLEGKHAHAGKKGGAHAGKKPAGAGNSKGSAKLKEPQATSDAQLKQAIQMLTQIESQLGNTHPKARTSVQMAIQELNTALTIK